MAQQKNQFAIQPVNLTPTSITQPSRGVTKAEERSYIEARKQLQTVEQERVITQRGQQAIGSMSRNGYQEFMETGEYIWQLKDRPGRAADLQQLMDGMANHCAQRTAAYLEAITDAGAASVLEVVKRGTYELPKQKVGLFGRVKDE